MNKRTITPGIAALPVVLKHEKENFFKTKYYRFYLAEEVQAEGDLRNYSENTSIRQYTLCKNDEGIVRRWQSRDEAAMFIRTDSKPGVHYIIIQKEISMMGSFPVVVDNIKEIL